MGVAIEGRGEEFFEVDGGAMTEDGGDQSFAQAFYGEEIAIRGVPGGAEAAEVIVDTFE
ncbi:MAG: hypothetical protein HC860_16180 [Alkalinema sp. RU_4_3]|nr:hypothetical protein [Alkalinema sp. RU_4_3]